MTTVIKQIVGDNSQTIRQVVQENERGPQGLQGPQGEPGKNGGTIQYSAGTGIDISDENVISATGVTSVAWGAITGTLSSQTDLQNALNAKANTSSLATVATTGQYSDLTGTPSLATVATTGAYSDLTGTPTLATVATSGLYSDLTGTPTTADFINLVYPVGSYYETSDTTFNPNVSWTGTWVEDTGGRVLVAMDTGTFTTVGATGGEETHTLTVAEMPSHSHNVNLTGDNSPSATGRLQWTAANRQEYGGSVLATGGGGAHNNLQPYIVVKRWHRTA